MGKGHCFDRAECWVAAPFDVCTGGKSSSFGVLMPHCNRGRQCAAMALLLTFVCLGACCFCVCVYDILFVCSKFLFAC